MMCRQSMIGFQFDHFQIRTFDMTIIGVTLCFLSFVFAKIFPTLLEVVDLNGSLLIFSTSCLLGAIFVLCVLKETTGQSLYDVGLECRTETQTHTQTTNI